MFTCCSSSGGGELNNILSILKNGSLYIGGSIRNQYDTSGLADKIEIANAGIYIDNTGRLTMDFGNIITHYSRPEIGVDIKEADEFKKKKLHYAEKLINLLKKENLQIEFINLSDSI